MILIIGFTDVEHKFVLTVDEDVCGLPGLAVIVESACEYNLMGGSVPDTSIVVVASVSYLQGFVLDIWFLCKDRIREVIQTKAILISF